MMVKVMVTIVVMVMTMLITAMVINDGQINSADNGNRDENGYCDDDVSDVDAD